MVSVISTPETPEEWLDWHLRRARDQLAVAQRDVDRLEKLKRGPSVRVEAHWMHYGSHMVDEFDTVEEAGRFLADMFQSERSIDGSPVGVTVAGMPVPWVDLYGDEQEADPTDLYFERATRL